LFEFKPKSYYVGKQINMAGSAIILLLLLFFGYSSYKESQKATA